MKTTETWFRALTRALSSLPVDCCHERPVNDYITALPADVIECDYSDPACLSNESGSGYNADDSSFTVRSRKIMRIARAYLPRSFSFQVKITAFSITGVLIQLPYAERFGVVQYWDCPRVPARFTCNSFES
jgi:hypothetical protein